MKGGKYLYLKFKKIITEKGITPYRISKDTGISQVTLSDWKHGRSIPKVDKLIKIANYLNLTLEELLHEEQEDTIET
jgi:transcriptional regulator with XRE-family HTH domain